MPNTSRVAQLHNRRAKVTADNANPGRRAEGTALAAGRVPRMKDTAARSLERRVSLQNSVVWMADVARENCANLRPAPKARKLAGFPSESCNADCTFHRCQSQGFRGTKARARKNAAPPVISVVKGLVCRSRLYALCRERLSKVDLGGGCRILPQGRRFLRRAQAAHRSSSR